MRAFDTDWVPEEEDLWGQVPDEYWEFYRPTLRTRIAYQLRRPLTHLACAYEDRLAIRGYHPGDLNRMQRWLLDQVPF